MQNNLAVTAKTVVAEHFGASDLYVAIAEQKKITREIAVTESNIKLLQHMLDTFQISGAKDRDRARNLSIKNLEKKIEDLKAVLLSEYGVRYEQKD